MIRSALGIRGNVLLYCLGLGLGLGLYGLGLGLGFRNPSDSLKCIKLDRSAWIWTLPGKLFIVRTRTACLPACHRPPRHNDVTQPKRFTVQHWRRAGACRRLRRTWQ